MSILGAMFTAVSGVNAQSRSLGHISDNIANSQTTGYKRVETRFETLITVSNQNLHSPGGVIASPYFANGVQGNITQTQNNTNLAVTGNGFFVVSRASNQTATDTTFDALRYYTRAGDFEVNRDGYLVNNGNYYLNGWEVDPETGIPNTSVVSPIQISQVIDEPTPTEEIEFVGNLPANAPVNPTHPAAADQRPGVRRAGQPAQRLAGLDQARRQSVDAGHPGRRQHARPGRRHHQRRQRPDRGDRARCSRTCAPVAQVNTITLPAAGMAPGRTISVTIGSSSVSVTAPSTGYTATQAASALVAAINGNAGMSSDRHRQQRRRQHLPDRRRCRRNAVHRQPRRQRLRPARRRRRPERPA